jgi:hypothetical protein
MGSAGRPGIQGIINDNVPILGFLLLHRDDDLGLDDVRSRGDLVVSTGRARLYKWIGP